MKSVSLILKQFKIRLSYFEKSKEGSCKNSFNEHEQFNIKNLIYRWKDIFNEHEVLKSVVWSNPKSDRWKDYVNEHHQS